MGFKCGILPMIILLNIPGSLGQSVKMSCNTQTICALRESAVNMQCDYSHINKPQQSFWFSPKQKAKWRNKEDPEDLALDPDYAGRVIYETRISTSITIHYTSALTIRDLRERDSGEYQLMIITETGEKYSSSTTLTLTVSDLQIKKISDKDNEWTLNCSTSCSLTSTNYYYIWYKNGRHIDSTYKNQKTIPGLDSASYSCSISDRPKIIRSSSVCVSGENCWSVIYSDRRVCVLEGSSVHFPCTYFYPSALTVTETFWFYFQPNVELTDLSKEERFAGRVEFLGDKERNCTLRMRNVTKSDSGEYRFRFITDSETGRFFGAPGVILNVTDLQVRVSPSSPSEGQTVTLTCISTCTLPNNPTYIWYKNGQPVANTRYNKLYLETASREDVNQYSCDLGGQENTTGITLMIVGVVVFLALVIIVGCIWMWRRKSRPSQLQRRTMDSSEGESEAVYHNVSALTTTSNYTQREISDGQDGVHYASIQFKSSRTLKEAPSTTSTLPLNAIEDQDVHYSTVNFRQAVRPCNEQINQVSF